MEGETARQTVVEYPIEATFRSPSFEDPAITRLQAKVNPIETNSCNLSTFATSSIPFFDGQLKNRDGEPTSETIVVIS